MGEHVYLRLQPYRQLIAAMRRNQKLSPRYFGPFEILERVGNLAYRLQLPKNSIIHPVFHVSLLKKFIGNKVIVLTELPLVVEPEGRLVPQP